ncbi:MAG TPA: GNAT family N-acetyltransferase [Streptosporangiaceae bacterium]|nr:GNAT family N-acetyltransferase [Streptosporangiaceae bacterium]
MARLDQAGVAMQDAALEVHTGASLDDVPVSSWLSFDPEAGFYQSRPWLEFVERTAGPAVAYTWVTGQGRTLGVLPVYQPARPGSGYALADLGGADSASGPVAVCGNRRGYRNEILASSLPAASEIGRAALAGLAAAAQEICDQKGWSNLVFPYLSHAYATVLRQELPQAIPLLGYLDANIDIAGRTFDEYVRGLGGKKADVVWNEIRRFERAGYATAVERLTDCWDQVGPLVANVQERYGHDTTAEECRQDLRTMSEQFAGHDLVFTARRGGKLIAAAVFFHWNDTLAGRVVGFDYANLADAMEYFNLYFYQPISYACEHGVTRILLGLGSERTKQLRGAQLSGLWTLAVGPAVTAGLGDWRTRNEVMRERLTNSARVNGARLSGVVW